MVPSSYKVQICSLFSASTRSIHLIGLKYIISAYNVVNIKCHNVVLSLNSKMESLQLKPSLSGRVWRLEYPELEISLHPARTPESTPPAEDNLVWRLKSLYATAS